MVPDSSNCKSISSCLASTAIVGSSLAKTRLRICLGCRNTLDFITELLNATDRTLELTLLVSQQLRCLFKFSRSSREGIAAVGVLSQTLFMKDQVLTVCAFSFADTTKICSSQISHQFSMQFSQSSLSHCPQSAHSSSLAFVDGHLLAFATKFIVVVSIDVIRQHPASENFLVAQEIKSQICLAHCRRLFCTGPLFRSYTNLSHRQFALDENNCSAVRQNVSSQ